MISHCTLMQNLPPQLMAAIRNSLYIKYSRKFYASYSNSVEKSCPNGTKIWSVRNCWISPTRNRKKIKYTCCVCADAHFTIKHFHFVRYSYAPATLFPKVHTTYEHKKNLKKTNSNCNKSVVLKVPSVALVQFSWK